jgi:hypothetical protein
MRACCSLVRATSIGLISTAFTGCFHAYYTPSAHQVPLHRQKGEFTATGMAGANAATTNFEAQASYAFHEHAAVMASYMQARSKKDQVNFGQGIYYEFAPGAYFANSNSSVFEIYGGIGHAEQQHTYGVFPNFRGIAIPGCSSKLSSSKFFVQPNVAMVGDHIEFAFSARLSMVVYYDISQVGNGGISNMCDINLDKLAGDPRKWLLEPGITFRTGGKFFKVHMQLGLAIPIAGTISATDYLNANAGVSLRLFKKAAPLQ